MLIQKIILLAVLAIVMVILGRSWYDLYIAYKETCKDSEYKQDNWG